MSMQRTPEQQEAITHIAPLICVDAGAGSGKTRVLIERMVHLLEAGHAELDEIVAITFTDKAAAEMKARLRRAFREKASTHDTARMTKWRTLERKVDTARISTIHTFCTGILRENALHLGLDPDFSVISAEEETLLLDAVVTETIHSLLEQQDEALLQLTDHFRTARLQQELKQLIKESATIAALQEGGAFSDPAALQVHWESLVAREREEMLLALRQHPERIRFIRALEGFEGCCSDESDKRDQLRRIILQALRELGDAETATAVQQLVNRMLTVKVTGTLKKTSFDSEETSKALSALNKDVKDWLKKNARIEKSTESLNQHAAALTCNFVTVYTAVAQAVENAKREAQQLDFDTLVTQAKKVLASQDTVRQRVARGIKFLLIDEFQDTDNVQLDIAKLLYNTPGGPDCFIVGDPKQSIYRFRGAEVQVFRDQRGEADHVIQLNRNFRTLPNVLAFVNDFFTASGRLHAVENYAPMLAHREALAEPRVEILRPVLDFQAKPDLQPRQEEAELIAARIREICEGPEPLHVLDESTQQWRDAQYGDIALLFRAFSKVHLYEEALRRQGIPYALASGSGFYERQEVQDILNALKLILDPWDEPALLAFLRSPLVGLSDDDLLRLALEGGIAQQVHAERIPDGLAYADRLCYAYAVLRDLRQRREQPLPALLHYLLDRTSYEAMLLAQYHGVQKVANVRKLLDLAAVFKGNAAPTLRAFVAYLDAIGSQAVKEPDAAMQSEDAGAVHLLSIHKSKGLEFPIVFVADMGQQPPPGSSTDVVLHRDLGIAVKAPNDFGKLEKPTLGNAIAMRHKREEENEYARLLYVALTRARDYLVLCGTEKANQNSWFGWLNTEYALLEKAHHAIISGTGWQARIVQTAAAQPVAAGTATGETPDLDAMKARALPIAMAAQGKQNIAISALLDHMADAIEVHEEDPGDEETPRFHPEAQYAMQRGTLVHRMFERWEFSSDSLPDIPPLLREARLGLGRREALREDLMQIAERFMKTDLYQRLRSAETIQREAPFLLKAGQAVISGTVDAWLPEGVIIDYKTGRYHEERHARYEWQLLLYAAAIRALGVGAPSEGILYYADEGIARSLALTEEGMDDALRQATCVIQELQKD